MNRVFLRFGYVGGDVLRKNKKDRTWSEYYIKDLRKIEFDPYTYLQNASRYGRLDHTIIALKIGADIHAFGDLVLTFASYYGYLDIIKYLVDMGADIHADNDFALKIARQEGYVEIEKYLESLD